MSISFPNPHSHRWLPLQALWLVALGLLAGVPRLPGRLPEVIAEALPSAMASFEPGATGCDLAVSVHGVPAVISPGASTSVTATVVNVGGSPCNGTVLVTINAPTGSFALGGSPQGVVAQGDNQVTFERTGLNIHPLEQATFNLSARLPMGIEAHEATFCATVRLMPNPGGGGGGTVSRLAPGGGDTNAANNSTCSYIGVGPCVEPALVAGLVGWWPLGTNANDQSPNAHHGSGFGLSYASGSPPWGPEQWLSLSAFNPAVVTVPDADDLEFGRFGEHTFDLWVNPNPMSGTRPILAKTPTPIGTAGFTGYALYTEGFDLRLALGDGTDVAVYSDQGLTFPGGVPSYLRHVTVVANLTPAGPTVTFYANGASQEGALIQGTPPTGPLANSAPLLFGQDASGGSKLGGTLAQVLIFNRALTPAKATILNQTAK